MTIHEVIAADQFAVLQLDTTIHRLNSERQVLVDRMNAHIALLSPLRRLPIELISRIFEHCLVQGYRPQQPSSRTAPFLLCRVSRFWRQVATMMPSLWTTIKSADIQKLSRPTVPLSRLHLFEIFLLRSQTARIQVTFDSTDMTSDLHRTKEYLSSALIKLIPHIPRCVKLEFEGIYYTHLSEFVLFPLQTTGFNWLALHELSITVTQQEDLHGDTPSTLLPSSQVIPFLPSYSRAPCLERLTLNLSCAISDFVPLPLPWG